VRNHWAGAGAARKHITSWTRKVRTGLKSAELVNAAESLREGFVGMPWTPLLVDE
jgi:hypothetical protein